MQQAKVLMVDNFDSFTFNLVDDVKKLGAKVYVVRNNLSLDEFSTFIQAHQITHLVISPGPGCPEEAGNCIPLIQRFYGKLPMLGICLGMQAMVVAFGGIVSPCGAMMHGKNSWISHSQQGIFKAIENPMLVGRYHSLAAQQVKNPLIVSAKLEEIVMAVEDPQNNLYGVQFHPESILTPNGLKLIQNFLRKKADESND